MSAGGDRGPTTAGPRVVAIGGGHGLAATLRAVATYTDHITAVVSVADDGGSSGRLRELLHIMPPGDLRTCLVALAEPDSLLATAFAHRFTEEELAGHALGNLILAGLWIFDVALAWIAGKARGVARAVVVGIHGFTWLAVLASFVIASIVFAKNPTILVLGCVLVGSVAIAVFARLVGGRGPAAPPAV